MVIGGRPVALFDEAPALVEQRRLDREQVQDRVEDVLLVVLGAIWFSGKEEPAEPDDLAFVDEHGDFDAFAGGYPVPPMPGQKLVTTVFPSTADDEREPVGAASPRRATANTNGADA